LYLLTKQKTPTKGAKITKKIHQPLKPLKIAEEG
jgi:hypothetical protein